MRAATAFLIMAPMVIVTLLFVGTQGRRAGAAGGPGAGAYWDESVAAFVRQRMGSTYVDPLDAKASEDAFWRAMDAYVRLDPYCDMIPPSEYRQWKEGTAGQYGGLGIRVDAEAEGLRIRGVLPGGPAQRAGLVAGDLVLSADGRPLAGIDLKSGGPARLLKGAPGSAVRLEVRDAAGQVRAVSAVRQVVRPPAVFVHRVGPQGQVAVLRVAEFVESTPQEVDQALDPLLAGEQGALGGLVLDLRDNPGGVLASAVYLADRFLAAGLVVRVVGRGPGTSRDFHAHASQAPADVPASVPVAVLVNAHSASASEVVAGALQDHRRALLVGERTYGKFLVQSIVEAPRGDCALQLVTARYYTPSGRSYQRRLA
ncbi:MAG: S41 family peptidase [Planctomycetia bacterium]